MPRKRTEFSQKCYFPSCCKSFQSSTGVSVMAEKGAAVCNLPLGPQCLGALVFEDLLSF